MLINTLIASAAPAAASAYAATSAPTAATHSGAKPQKILLSFCSLNVRLNIIKRNNFQIDFLFLAATTASNPLATTSIHQRCSTGCNKKKGAKMNFKQVAPINVHQLQFQVIHQGIHLLNFVLFL